jgi:hypothetical protein
MGQESVQEEYINATKSVKPGEENPATDFNKSRGAFEFYLKDLEDNNIMDPGYEPRWPLWAKIMIKPFMVFAAVEAIIWLSLTWVFMKIFPVSEDFKRDPRRWPTSLLLFSTGTGCRYVKTNSMSWKALEYLNCWIDTSKQVRGFDHFISNLWNQLENVRATRNRLRNVKSVLYFQILEKLQRGGNIHIASLAAGSARGPVEVIARICKKYAIPVERFKLLLIDADPESLLFARDLAESLHKGLESRITTRQHKISGKPEKLADLKAVLAEFEPSIIEMVGFTDYMSPEKSVRVFSALHDILPEQGLLITNNVTPNDEQFFLELVVVWRMKNRTEEEMRAIFKKAGYEDIFVIWEPTGIQPVYVLRKDFKINLL